MTLKVLLLAAFQGVAEFLPISSSGHLAIAERLLGVDCPGHGLELLLHFGTLLAVLAFYRRRVALLLLGLALGVREAWRQTGLLVLGCIPAVAAYALFKGFFERCEKGGVPLIGAMLMVTGAAIISTRWARKGRKGEVRVPEAIVVGLAQAAALLPGISRSGSTIAAARHMGVEGRAAADYSFLMSAVLLIGASLQAAVKGGATADLGGICAGTAILAVAVSAVVGYYSLRLLIVVLSGRRFWLFGIYCLVAGAVAWAA